MAIRKLGEEVSRSMMVNRALSVSLRTKVTKALGQKKEVVKVHLQKDDRGVFGKILIVFPYFKQLVFYLNRAMKSYDELADAGEHIVDVLKTIPSVLDRLVKEAVLGALSELKRENPMIKGHKIISSKGRRLNFEYPEESEMSYLVTFNLFMGPSEGSTDRESGSKDVVEDKTAPEGNGRAVGESFSADAAAEFGVSCGELSRVSLAEAFFEREAVLRGDLLGVVEEVLLRSFDETDNVLAVDRFRMAGADAEFVLVVESAEAVESCSEGREDLSEWFDFYQVVLSERLSKRLSEKQGSAVEVTFSDFTASGSGGKVIVHLSNVF